MATRIGRPDLTDVLTRPRIRQEQVDAEQVALGEIDQILAVRADLRGDIYLTTTGGFTDQFFADVAVFSSVTYVGSIGFA